MKSTVVDESLSYYKTNVLFQRILQDFKSNSQVYDKLFNILLLALKNLQPHLSSNYISELPLYIF